MVHEWLTASASQLADWIRTQQVSSREIVDAHITYAQKVNPYLNAIVAERFAQAQKEADAADDTLRNSTPAEAPPFLGVPCTIKECFALRGMPQTAGLVARKGTIADTDATAVQRWLKAGAVPLGVTNLSELCMWLESNNAVYGRTNNPYDPGRMVGGSSGGEGSIVGSGASPFGLGSDIGGSIRLPAFFNGVFGHKPTGTLVPGTGQFPAPHEGPALRYLTTGPLCRKAEDLWPLLQLLVGPDGHDHECQAWELGHPSDVKLSDLRVLHIPDNGSTRVHPDLVRAQQNVADFLRSEGAQVETLRVPLLKKSLDIWASMLEIAQGPHAFRDLLGYKSPWPLFWELCKWCVGQSKHTAPSIVLGLADNLSEVFPNHAARMLTLGNELRETLCELLGDDGIFLFPSYAEPAPIHSKPLLTPFHWVYTAVLNVMEVPVTQVPLGLNTKGLPLGVQVGASHGHDHKTIAVAMALEEEFGGWVPPWQSTHPRFVAPAP